LPRIVATIGHVGAPIILVSDTPRPASAARHRCRPSRDLGLFPSLCSSSPAVCGWGQGLPADGAGPCWCPVRPDRRDSPGRL